jgi:hypothetical protein
VQEDVLDGGIIADLVARHAAEIPVWGHLPAAMRLKEAAVAQLGVDAAFAACRPALGVPGIDLLRARELQPLHAAAARSPHYALAWPGGACVDRPMPEVIGEGNHAPMPGRERDGYLACLDDVLVRGRSSLLRQDDALLIDAEPGEYEMLPDCPAYDPGVLHHAGRTLWTMEPVQAALEVDEAFLLTGNHSVDFGHWMTEYLPRYALAVEAGLPPGTPMLLDPNIPATILAALPRLLPAGTPLLRLGHLDTARVRRLWCASGVGYYGFYPMHWTPATWAAMATAPRPMARWLQRLGALFDGGNAGATPTPARVYLSRKPSRHKKKLLDHPQIEAVAQARGFHIVYPEDLDLHAQVARIRGATHVVAPDGSNALLAWFARPGTRMLLLSPPYTLPLVDVNAILAELGVAATVLTGPDEPTLTDFCAYWNDYRIGEDRFAAVLGDWLAR